MIRRSSARSKKVSDPSRDGRDQRREHKSCNNSDWVHRTLLLWLAAATGRRIYWPFAEIAHSIPSNGTLTGAGKAHRSMTSESHLQHVHIVWICDYRNDENKLIATSTHKMICSLGPGDGRTVRVPCARYFLPQCVSAQPERTYSP